jgi:hypothetical protein
MTKLLMCGEPRAVTSVGRGVEEGAILRPRIESRQWKCDVRGNRLRLSVHNLLSSNANGERYILHRPKLPLLDRVAGTPTEEPRRQKREHVPQAVVEFAAAKVLDIAEEEVRAADQERQSGGQEKGPRLGRKPTWRRSRSPGARSQHDEDRHAANHGVECPRQCGRQRQHLTWKVDLCDEVRVTNETAGCKPQRAGRKTTAEPR